LAQLSEADLVLVATVGAIGMVPTIAALKAGKSVALANKEALVMGGDLVMKEAGSVGPRLIPVDSEHSAIFQCIGQHPTHEVSRILLTGSGGPFRKWSDQDLQTVTVAQALNHPNWSMGNKITIDSATLMNKGLELIEAMHLFGLPADRIRVVVHPQSIVHSLVEFQDRSVLAQMGLPDMRLPIQYSLSYPERWGAEYPCLDLFAAASLTFEEPDLERFPCLRLAYEAARTGGTMPAQLSVCNEEAVHAFLKERIGFCDIARIIETVLERLSVEESESVEQLLDLEQLVRAQAREEIERFS
ncbi:MAG TPA: 1-deoxy-D-xylulose-5-phosphate reductoisomerase, partial [bacterium]|nr:1-deoxy-D-xylulose-5-phosphate reductoisomerase [bacterium]